jgi:type IX secretion system PorP/SprF family membrane protein
MELKKNIAYLFINLLIFSGFARNVSAQQDPMYTQYMDNLLIVNPGYAGSQGVATIMAVSRNQWVAVEGAPQTRTVSFQTPLKDLGLGVGLSVLSDRIGPLNQMSVYFDYSYQLKMNEDFKLSMGLKGGFSSYRAALAELETIQPDPIYERDIYKNFLPNFGFGGFLFSDDTYIGISIPRLIENSIGRGDDYSSEYLGREKMHFYITGGKVFIVNEDVKIKGHTLIKMLRNTPLTADITAMAGLKERLWFGAMFRFGNSWGLLSQINVTDEVMVGYSYDANFSGLTAFNSGTHEIMVRYSLNLFRF